MPVYKVDPLESNNEPGLGTRLGYSILRGLEAPGQVANTISQAITGDPLIRDQTISQELMQRQQVNPKQLAPQGLIESGTQRFLEGVPTIAATGGGIPSLLSSAAGSGLGATAGAFGASPELQTALQVATDVTTGRALRSIPKVGKQPAQAGGLPRLYKDQQKITQDAAKKGAEGANITDILTQPIEQMRRVYDTGSKATRNTLNQLDRVINNVVEGNGNLKFLDGLEIRRTVDELLKNATPQAKKVLNGVRHGINDYLKYFNPTNPEFAKSLAKEDQIWTLNQLSKNASDYLQGLQKGQYSKFLGTPVNKAVSKGMEVLNNSALLLNNDIPLFGKYLWNASEAAAKNNKSAFLNSINQLEKATKKVERPTSIKKGKVYRVLA